MRSTSGPDWGRLSVPLNIIVKELLEEARREGEARAGKDGAEAPAKGEVYVDRAKLLGRVIVFEVSRISADSGGKRKRCILTWSTLGNLLGWQGALGRSKQGGESVELREAKANPAQGHEQHGAHDTEEANKGFVTVSGARLQYERSVEVLHPFTIDCSPSELEPGSGATFVIVGKRSLRAAADAFIECQSDSKAVRAEWTRRGVMPQLFADDEASRPPSSLGGEMAQGLTFEGAIALSVCSQLAAKEHSELVQKSHDTRKAAAGLLVGMLTSTYQRRKTILGHLEEELAGMARDGNTRPGMAPKLYRALLSWFLGRDRVEGRYAVKGLQAAAARCLLSSNSAVRRATIECAVECAVFIDKSTPVDEGCVDGWMGREEEEEEEEEEDLARAADVDDSFERAPSWGGGGGDEWSDEEEDDGKNAWDAWDDGQEEKQAGKHPAEGSSGGGGGGKGGFGGFGGLGGGAKAGEGRGVFGTEKRG